MKKAKAALATYRDNHVYNLEIVTCRGDFITLISYDPVDVAHPYKDRTYKSMIQGIIQICKNNGYALEYKKMFDAKFYNISLINLDDPQGRIECFISH